VVIGRYWKHSPLRPRCRRSARGHTLVAPISIYYEILADPKMRWC
jgi:hypothetical protein